MNLPIRKWAVDISLAFEIIEPLPASKGKLFLASLEAISRKGVIFSTPNYKYLQDEIRGNPYEKHVSFWKYKDFPKKYKMRGVGVQIKEKIFISAIPVLGYFLNRLILFGKICRFSELIVAIIRLKTE